MTETRPSSRHIARDLALVTALIVLIMLTATWQGVPQFSPTPPGTTAPTEETPSPEATQTTPPEEGEVAAERSVYRAVAVITVAAFAIFVVLLLISLIRLFAEMLQRRLPGRRGGVKIAPSEGVGTPTEELIAEVVQEGLADALERIYATRVAGDAVVAAWMSLEESAATVGLERAKTETAGEFAARVLGSRGGVATDAIDLLGLYERVRFGDYQAEEADRTRAIATLRRIEKEWK